LSERRDAILDAARACFEEHGYAATTIELIAARSAASNGSIYHHFGSKDGILAALYGDAVTSYQDELLALLRSHDTDAEGGIRGAVEHHLAWVEANPRETRTLFEHRQTLERAGRADELRARNQPALREMRAWLGRHVAAGTVRDLGPAAAAVWFGPAQLVARDWIARRLRGKPSALAPALAEAAWRSFRA
jgi:AcrR family transcriptional regulator